VHVSFRVETEVSVHCCGFCSLWQRSTNRMLQRHLPRNVDTATVTARQVELPAAEMNIHSRRTLAYTSPAKESDEFLSLAD